MISDDDLEKEMHDDLDYLYQAYKQQLQSGKSSVKSLNVLIRALKHAHRFYSIDDENNEEEDEKERTSRD